MPNSVTSVILSENPSAAVPFQKKLIKWFSGALKHNPDNLQAAQTLFSSLLCLLLMTFVLS